MSKQNSKIMLTKIGPMKTSINVSTSVTLLSKTKRSNLLKIPNIFTFSPVLLGDVQKEIMNLEQFNLPF